MPSYSEYIFLDNRNQTRYEISLLQLYFKGATTHMVV